MSKDTQVKLKINQYSDSIIKLSNSIINHGYRIWLQPFDKDDQKHNPIIKISLRSRSKTNRLKTMANLTEKLDSATNNKICIALLFTKNGLYGFIINGDSVSSIPRKVVNTIKERNKLSIKTIEIDLNHIPAHIRKNNT